MSTPAFLALLASLTAAGVTPEHARIPTPSGVTLDAALLRPVGPVKAPAVVALHGCGGPYAARDGGWAVELARLGHVVLLPDSFGSRGLGSQCRVKERTVRPAQERRDDAIAAGTWLMAQPGVPAGGMVLLGWSNGGQTTLATARQADDLPRGLFLRFVAFYPGCARINRDTTWRPAGPLLILVGEADDWTPAEPCRRLAGRFPEALTLITYPGAYHDFDAPGRRLRLLTGLATTRDGTAHAGTDPAARADALARVPGFVAGSGDAR
jgi:dienelactone hydrolase